MPEPTLEEELQKLQAAEAKVKAEQEKLEAIKEEVEGYEAKKSALEKEEQRLKAAILALREEKRKSDATFQEKFKKEQLNKAQEKFFQDFGYTEAEAQNKLLEVYQKIDDGSVDAENIYRNLEKAHVLLNASSYIALEKKAKELSGSAEEFLKQQSSSAFPSGGEMESGKTVVLDAEDEEAIRKFHIPRERYIELKAKGKI